ncbi:hypothetical protein V2W45_617356 [Cenococcum geophilum]
MISKTSVFTTITPLPGNITREAVISTYHNHIEMIELNPLVVERFKCKPPSFATPEEFHAIWYTIKDKISYLPGGLATGSVSYHGCFHDLPEGLQTHVYAPLGLDIKAKWTVGGSLPGEPKQPAELGLGIPKEGLYLREDVKMKCNVMMLSFVKKTFKDAHSKLVDRLVEKTHLLEAKAANERLGARSPSLMPASPGMFPGSPAPHSASPAFQHLSVYSNASSGHTDSPLASPRSQHTSPALQHAATFGHSQQMLSPQYGVVDPAYHAANPYAQDPRLSQYPVDPRDPRFSQYPPDQKDPRFSYYQDPRNSYQPYTPPPAQFGAFEMSAAKDDSKHEEQTGPAELA